MASPADFKRHDDDPLYQRLTRLETQVGTLETKVNTLTLEQQHMLQLFGARFTTLEKSMELTFAEVRSVSQQLTGMASEAEKSPAGRMMLRRIDQLDEAGDDSRVLMAQLGNRMNQYDGGLALMRWMGFGGLVSGLSALLWVWLRSQGIGQ